MNGSLHVIRKSLLSGCSGVATFDLLKSYAVYLKLLRIDISLELYLEMQFLIMNKVSAFKWIEFEMHLWLVQQPMEWLIYAWGNLAWETVLEEKLRFSYMKMFLPVWTPDMRMYLGR